MSSLLPNLKRFASPSSLKSLWGVLKAMPKGGVVMGRIIGQMAPYTGTIRPEILALEPGFARVRMNDARRVRNHLNSVHAIALMNLGEVSTGTAMLVSVPEGARAIITHLGMDYLKKARGPITAECTCEVPTTLERKEYEVTADLKNADGVVVARAHARWLVDAA
jgi:acyl-coenzyme A thioesterase PaaI-like protein